MCSWSFQFIHFSSSQHQFSWIVWNNHWPKSRNFSFVKSTIIFHQGENSMMRNNFDRKFSPILPISQQFLIKYFSHQVVSLLPYNNEIKIVNQCLRNNNLFRSTQYVNMRMYVLKNRVTQKKNKYWQHIIFEIFVPYGIKFTIN